MDAAADTYSYADCDSNGYSYCYGDTYAISKSFSYPNGHS